MVARSMREEWTTRRTALRGSSTDQKKRKRRSRAPPLFHPDGRIPIKAGVTGASIRPFSLREMRPLPGQRVTNDETFPL